jgi:zinc D-Ala-D-Ala dipeptidase
MPAGLYSSLMLMLHRARLIALLLVLVGCGGCASTRRTVEISPAPTAQAAGMIDIQSLVPDIRLDMRYVGSDNFVGARITGYDAPRCYLLHAPAEALQRVELALRAQSLRLQIFDCYRPVRAVRHFVAWARDLDDQRTKPFYYPNLAKTELLGEYIAPTSGHSRGSTLDLTLMECDASGAHCTPLDMGTSFDFFDPLANTDAPQITPAQQANRQRLREALQREGFSNYPLEWWHYTFQPEPATPLAYDFPIR